MSENRYFIYMRMENIEMVGESVPKSWIKVLKEFEHLFSFVGPYESICVTADLLHG